MPEIIAHLAQQAQFIEIIRGQPPQREPLEVGAAREEDDQQQAEQEAGNGKTDDDGGAAPHIEAAAVLHCLADAQRYGYQIGDHGAPQTERNGHRQTLQDQFGHRAVTVIGFTKIAGEVILDH